MLLIYNWVYYIQVTKYKKKYKKSFFNSSNSTRLGSYLSKIEKNEKNPVLFIDQTFSKQHSQIQDCEMSVAHFT